MHDTHEHIDPNKKTLELLKKKKEESQKNTKGNKPGKTGDV